MRTLLNLAHQWGWAVPIIGYAFIFAAATDSNSKAIAAIQAQNLNERMATQEQMTKDMRDDVASIKDIDGKIFDRLNQLADRPK